MRRRPRRTGVARTVVGPAVAVLPAVSVAAAAPVLAAAPGRVAAAPGQLVPVRARAAPSVAMRTSGRVARMVSLLYLRPAGSSGA